MENLQRSNIDVTMEAAQDILDVNSGILHANLQISERKSHVKINVSHLKQVKNNEFGDWNQFTLEQISKIDEAIAIGNSYVSAL